MIKKIVLVTFLLTCCADSMNPSVACVKAGGQWMPENGCHAAYCTQPAAKKVPSAKASS